MGKNLIIKGADFSVNAVAHLKKVVTDLIYDSDGNGDYQKYNGSPYPIETANGAAMLTTTLPSITHAANCLVTDKVTVDEYTHFKVHSIFNVTANTKVVAIGFFGSNDTLIGYYNTVTPETIPSKYIGTVPTTNAWCDFEGSIPVGTSYMRVGCYDPHASEERFLNFSLELT